MFAYKTHIDENGRIVIPAKIRKAANLAIGQSIILNVENTEVKISAYSEKLKDIQGLVQPYTKGKGSLVDQLTKLRAEELANE